MFAGHVIGGDQYDGSQQRQVEAAPDVEEASLGRPQTSDTQTFVSEHAVSNEAPASSEAVYAKPLATSWQTSGDQDFASQHQVNNEAPASEGSMYSEPLTSDRPPSRAQQPGHQTSAAGGDGSSCSMTHSSDDQAFASQHHVSNEAPSGQPSMLAQPLTSDRQTPGDQGFAPEHRVRNEAPMNEGSMLAQPLTSDQQGAHGQQPEAAPGSEEGSEEGSAPTQHGDSRRQQSEHQQDHEPHQSLTGDE